MSIHCPSLTDFQPQHTAKKKSGAEKQNPQGFLNRTVCLFSFLNCLFIAQRQLQCIVIPFLPHGKNSEVRSILLSSIILLQKHSIFQDLIRITTYNWSSGKISSKLKPIHLHMPVSLYFCCKQKDILKCCHTSEN